MVEVDRWSSKAGGRGLDAVTCVWTAVVESWKLGAGQVRLEVDGRRSTAGGGWRQQLLDGMGHKLEAGRRSGEVGGRYMEVESWRWKVGCRRLLVNGRAKGMGGGRGEGRRTGSRRVKS